MRSLSLTKIKKSIQTGESETLEFKSSTAELQKACQTLCGFLNNKGGSVLIGVKQDGRLVGQKVADHTRLDIAKELKKFEPVAPVTVDYLPVNSETAVISLQVSKGPYSPYVYDGRPYQRIESSTRVMPQDLYRQLLSEQKGYNLAWEALPNRQYSINNLDHDEIYKTVKQGIDSGRVNATALKGDINDILHHLDLLDQNNDLKNAALILFSKNTTFDQENLIKMARFKGATELAEFIDNRQSRGHAFKVLSDAADFIMHHLPIAGFLKPDSFVRTDKPALPVLAVREALINAVCHREYPSRASISVAIFDDRLEIWNPGKLPSSLGLEDLSKKHRSVLRNELVANVFYKRGFIESWGTGTVKIVEGCLEHGIPEPKFEEYSGGFAITFFFAKSIGPYVERQQNSSTIDLTTLSTRQQKIIQLLKAHQALKASELKEKLGEPIADRTLRDDLLLLKKKGLIGSRGHTNQAEWFAK